MPKKAGMEAWKKKRRKTPAEIAPGTKVYELVEELGKYLPEVYKRDIGRG